MAQRNVKLTIAYDGSRYHGWQRQEQQIDTVQQTLEGAIARVVNHPVSLRGSGRTDAGVHAAGQVANFQTDSPIPDTRLHYAVNSRLPHDIRVRKAEDVADGFDAMGSSVSKLYRYTVFNHHDLPPQADNYCYHYYNACEIPPMRLAAAELIGEHDFSSFASSGNQRQSNVRRLFRCQVWRKYHWLYFNIEGDGFLYNMVRNIVGTLLDIGRGHWQPERINEILAGRDRTIAGPMAPAHGLCLQWVRYEKQS